MMLAVTCVSEVNTVFDHDGIPRVQKAIIQCVLTLNTNRTPPQSVYEFAATM